MKQVFIICRFFVLVLLVGYVAPAHAQFTVFDPTTYAEEVQNFGQLYNVNQTALQQFQTAVQQYNLLNSQYQRLTTMTRYATSANAWSVMPTTFNSQGRIGGWATTINVGGYSNANAALGQTQYQYTMPTGALNGTPDQIARLSMQASSVDLHNNSLQDSLAVVGGIRNNAIANDVALHNLAVDSLDNADPSVTTTAMAQKQTIALSIIAQAQSDTNKALAALIELQMASAQQIANDRSMALTDTANQIAGWQNGSQASGTGTGTLNASYIGLQNAAVNVAQ